MEDKKNQLIKIIAVVMAISITINIIISFELIEHHNQIIKYINQIPGINLKNKNNLAKKTNKQNSENTIVKVQEESAIISAVEKTSPAVVSIIASKDLPIIERYQEDPFGSEFFRHFFGDDFGMFNFGKPQQKPKKQEQKNKTKKTEISKGTGFIISQDGYIVTNKHVVSYNDVDYTVLMNDEKKYEAKVLARDPINDLAILKIEAKNLPIVQLGDSDNLKVGQTTIAIGNALGEFKNTVSTGVISGLSRSIVASSMGFDGEELIDVIQTDASINPGNSGGPLLNISGQVIGINTAMASGAQNIGFAIPINEVKSLIQNVQKNGKLIMPWLGVRYIMINKEIAEKNNLKQDYGALISRGEEIGDLAVIPGSPADKANLVENDIILEVDDKKINNKNPLNKIIAQHKPGDKIKLKILHKSKEKKIEITLEERKDNSK